MKGSSTWPLYCFVLSLALALGLSNSSRFILGHKYFVRMVNNINDKDAFTFTCLSDGDKIGPRELAPNQQWEWGFRAAPNTEFQCVTWYQSSSGGPNHTVDSFPVFRRYDVPSYGGVHAIWSARETGMWLCNTDTGEYTLKYTW